MEVGCVADGWWFACRSHHHCSDRRCKTKSTLAPFYTSKVISLGFVLFSFSTGFNIFCSIALARSVETDLHFLAALDNEIEDGTDLLRVAPILIPAIIFGFLAGQSLLLVVDMVTMELSITARFSALFASDAKFLLFFSLILTASGATGGILFAVILRQAVSLIYTARHIRIDLLQVVQYSNIANPAVRMVVLILIILSLFPPMVLFIDNPIFSTAAVRYSLLVLTILLPLLLGYFYPVLILRTRIGQAKQKELQVVLSSLQGDDEALDRVAIQGRGVPKTTADLLTHQIFLESRWEWPIATHVQRLILFGLLPPLTWVLAATIENVLY